MNKQSEETASPDDGTDSPAKVVADNYERYLEDEYGYEYGARDILPIRVLESHDRLADDPEAGLADRELDDLGDFERLGLARGFAAAGAFESFADVLDRLLESDAEHEAVRYPELPLLGARIALRHGADERALDWLRRGTERWPDRARPARLLRARITLRRGDHERAAELYESVAEDHAADPELAFEIAEDLVAEGFTDWASEWAARSRETAQRVGDTAIEVDLDVLEARIEGA